MSISFPRPVSGCRAAVFLLFICCGAAAAESPSTDQQDAPELETLLVTAHRVPARETEAGSAVSVLAREDVVRRQIIHTADLLQDVPGVAVSRAGGYGAQTQVRMRGAEANQVLVLIDGVKANDPAGSDEFDFASLTSYDIDRIEVVRGPQSALWGSEAAAGVINITTRRSNAPLTAAGFIEGGSRDTLYTGGRIGGSGDRGGISVNASWFETGGVSSALAGMEDDGYQNFTVGLNANYQPAPGSRLAFSGRYNEAEVAFDGLDINTGLPADADLLSENQLLLLKAEGGLSVFDDRWDHNLRLTWLDSDRQQYRDGSWESSTAAEKLGAYYQSTLELETASQQVIVAVDYERETFDQRGLVVFGDPNQSQARDNLGWVAEYLLTPLSGLNLSGSLRHDDNSDFQDVTTYRLTASYLIAQTATRLRASYGTGQKAPTFVEQFGFFPESFIGNPNLKPEHTRGFDIGLIQTLGDDRWQLDIGYFDTYLEDELITTFVPGTFLSTAENLQADSRRKGVELAARGSLVRNLDLSLSYTYTDSTQPDAAREVRRPKHMAALNLDYSLLSGTAGINLNLSYTGSQDDRIFPPPLFAPETVALPDYLLVNLAGRYAMTDRLDLYLRAENLFDQDYVNVVGYSSPGRSVHLGVRMGFGR